MIWPKKLAILPLLCCREIVKNCVADTSKLKCYAEKYLLNAVAKIDRFPLQPTYNVS